MKKTFLFNITLFCSLFVFSQEVPEATTIEEVPTLEDEDLVEETFHSTRIINGHSIETLEKGMLEFRIEHRFGDFAGSNGGAQNWFGFDNAADIRFAFEYGLTNDFMIGLGRSKGSGPQNNGIGSPYRSLIDGFAKYRILKQKRHGMPLSMTAIGAASITYMKASPDISRIDHFPKFAHRMAYATQLNIARKFGSRFSLALMPTLVYSNYVAANDVNALFSIGGAVKYNITKKVALIVEYYQNVHGNDVRKDNTNSLGVAVEWVTFGHNFTINFTNSKGFGETQFIPYTFENWSKGQFRLGFCISRKFTWS